jgi:hypothetical protein
MTASSNEDKPRDEADDDAHPDDSLPSIREMMASLASEEQARTKQRR